MAAHRLDRFERRALAGHELVVHRPEILPDDMELRGREQMMIVRDSPGDRIIDRNHGVFRLALLDRREGVLEGPAGQGVHIGEGMQTGAVRIGPRLSLKRDEAVGGRLFSALSLCFPCRHALYSLRPRYGAERGVSGRRGALSIARSAAGNGLRPLLQSHLTCRDATDTRPSGLYSLHRPKRDTNLPAKILRPVLDTLEAKSCIHSR